MENTILFLGASNVGKSHTMLILAKLLSLLGKNVAAIDCTKSQGVYNFYNYNTDLEAQEGLNKMKEIIRDDVTIFVNNPCLNLDLDLSELFDYDFSKFDYILIETDENIPQKLITKADKIFLVQNSDKDKLFKNVNILKKSNIDAEKLTFIFNQVLENKFDKVYLLSTLIDNIKHKGLMLNNEDIEIEFSEDDLIVSLDNKSDGVISIKNYSDNFKLAMYELVNKIIEVDNKKFSKIMKDRRI